MSINSSYLGLAIPALGVTPTSRSFRPPSWPPPKDWVCIEDKDGNPVSRYGDSVIVLTPWVGKVVTFNFGDGPQTHSRSVRIDATNADLLRVLFAWCFWGPRARTVSTSLITLKQLRSIIAVCSKEGIKASDLSRFGSVIDKVAASIAPSQFDDVISVLDRLRDVREILGFELLDQAGIQRLKALQPDYEPMQTVYIPPGIWKYIVNRVAECRNDFVSHQKQIEECFAFSVEAYENNGAVEYRKKTGKSRRNPFQLTPTYKQFDDMTYYGPFADTAQRFGIKDVIEKWTGQITSTRSILALTNYFQLVQYAALIDVAAFTLMRIEEASNIRWNCMRWEDDPVYGRIPLIESETTKTDPDSNALWITSPSVEPSILALQSIAKMRLTSAGRWEDGVNPKLITPALEPWRGGRKKTKKWAETQPSLLCLMNVVENFPHLFDLQQLTITEDDLKIVRAVCPKLDSDRYKVGNLWPLAWHQFRRTGAVNMFASGAISDSSMQLQMKHLTCLMSLYYGRGNTALHLNDAARTLLVNAFYENLGREIATMLTDRYVSPYGEEHKAKLFAPANNGEPVNLINEGDAKHLAKIYRLHQIGGRLTAVGACMKGSRCDDGDGFSAVAACAGGDGKNPCAHTLFDLKRMPANQKRLDAVNHLLNTTPVDTPRYRSLEQEKRGLENYFAYIQKTA